MAPSLTNVETQRIMAILEETYHKLQLLSHVPPLRRVPNYEIFSNEVGPEVAQVLDEQVLLEQQYKWVSTPQHEQQDAGFDGGGGISGRAVMVPMLVLPRVGKPAGGAPALKPRSVFAPKG